MEQTIRQSIIHMLDGIHDVDRLKRIHKFVQLIYIHLS